MIYHLLAFVAGALACLGVTCLYLVEKPIGVPRKPSRDEKEALRVCEVNRAGQMLTDIEYREIQDAVEDAWIAVFDDYMPDCPGRSGKIAVVVFGFLEAYQVYHFDNLGIACMIEQDPLFKEV